MFSDFPQIYSQFESNLRFFEPSWNFFEKQSSQQDVTFEGRGWKYLEKINDLTMHKIPKKNHLNSNDRGKHTHAQFCNFVRFISSRSTVARSYQHFSRSRPRPCRRKSVVATPSRNFSEKSSARNDHQDRNSLLQVRARFSLSKLRHLLHIVPCYIHL